jgi:hypothetical protein
LRRNNNNVVLTIAGNVTVLDNTYIFNISNLRHYYLRILILCRKALDGWAQTLPQAQQSFFMRLTYTRYRFNFLPKNVAWHLKYPLLYHGLKFLGRISMKQKRWDKTLVPEYYHIYLGHIILVPLCNARR